MLSTSLPFVILSTILSSPLTFFIVHFFSFLNIHHSEILINFRNKGIFLDIFFKNALILRFVLTKIRHIIIAVLLASFLQYKEISISLTTGTGDKDLLLKFIFGLNVHSSIAFLLFLFANSFFFLIIQCNQLFYYCW